MGKRVRKQTLYRVKQLPTTFFQHNLRTGEQGGVGGGVVDWEEGTMA